MDFKLVVSVIFSLSSLASLYCDNNPEFKISPFRNQINKISEYEFSSCKRVIENISSHEIKCKINKESNTLILQVKRECSYFNTKKHTRVLNVFDEINILQDQRISKEVELYPKSNTHFFLLYPIEVDLDLAKNLSLGAINHRTNQQIHYSVTDIKERR